MVEVIANVVAARVLSRLTARRVCAVLTVALIAWGCFDGSACRVVGDSVAAFSRQHERATMFIVIAVASIVVLFLYLEARRFFSGWRRRLSFDDLTGCYVDRRNGRRVCPNHRCWGEDVPPYVTATEGGRLRCPNCGRRYPLSSGVFVGGGRA